MEIAYLDRIRAPLRNNATVFCSNRNNMLAFKGRVDKLLDDASVLKIFTDEITPIFRESGHCENISNYLTGELEKEGFNVIRQKEGPGKGNIIASRNVTGNNATILQAHMDMVYVSRYSHEELELIRQGRKKPIELSKQGDYIVAKRSSLGADDGIGVALALGIARIKDIEFKKIPLQIIFTVDEETGLNGAKALPDTVLRGKNLINLDINSLGKIIVGCAGIKDFIVNEKVKTQNMSTYPLYDDNGFKELTITLSGFKGGHSGLDINKGHANPVNMAFKILNDQKDNLIIKEISSGEVINTIPGSIKLKIMVSEANSETIKNSIQKTFKSVNEQYSKTDSGINLTINEKLQPAPDIKVIDPEFQKKLFEFLTGDRLKSGVLNINDGSKKPITSQNIGVLKLAEDNLSLSIRLRTNSKADYNNQGVALEDTLSQLTGKPIKATNTTPVWSTPGNELAEIAAKTYKETGVIPIISETHGSMECAELQKLAPGVNMIGVGSTAKGLHSLSERLVISTIKPMCEFLVSMITKLNNKDTRITRENIDLTA